MDEEERAMVNQGNAGPAANGEAAAPQPPADRHAFVRTEEEDDAPMRIVKDYQRPSARWGLVLQCKRCQFAADSAQICRRDLHNRVVGNAEERLSCNLRNGHEAENATSCSFLHLAFDRASLDVPICQTALGLLTRIHSS